jgi:hypothetical protein
MLISYRTFGNSNASFYPKKHHIILVVQNKSGRNLPPNFLLKVCVDETFEVTTADANRRAAKKTCSTHKCQKSHQQWSFRIKGNHNPLEVLGLLHEVKGQSPNFECPSISLKKYCESFLSKGASPPQPQPPAVRRVEGSSQGEQGAAVEVSDTMFILT